MVSMGIVEFAKTMFSADDEIVAGVPITKNSEPSTNNPSFDLAISIKKNE